MFLPLPALREHLLEEHGWDWDAYDALWTDERYVYHRSGAMSRACLRAWARKRAAEMEV